MREHWTDFWVFNKNIGDFKRGVEGTAYLVEKWVVKYLKEWLEYIIILLNQAFKTPLFGFTISRPLLYSISRAATK